MATFQPRANNGCTAKIRIKGQKISRTFYPAGKKTARQLAEAWARQEEEKILAGNYKSAKLSQTTTLLEALETYDTQFALLNKGYPAEKRRIKTWKKWKFVTTKLSDLTTEMFDEYRDYRRKWVKDGTIRLDLAVISAVFKHTKYGIENPAKETISSLSENTKRNRRLKVEEQKYLFEALFNTECSDSSRSNQFLPLVSVFAIETACRLSEIVKDAREHTTGVLRENVQIDDAGLKSTAFILNTKNGTDRFIPLTPTAVEVIERAFKLKPGKKGPVFPTTVSAINQGWHRAKNRAIKKYLVYGGKDPGFLLDFHFHDLRHEAASRWKKYFDIPRLKDLTGHKDIRSLMRYVHSDQSDIEEMAEEMAKIQKANKGAAKSVKLPPPAPKASKKASKPKK